jgi:enoyl-CoA hydratase/carnithine racemase
VSLPVPTDVEATYETIVLTVSEGIATLTLNRPEALNSFTDAMEAELIEALDRCDDDDEVRVVVITGAGRAFCAGMDLSDSSATFDTWRRGATPTGALSAELPIRRDGGGRVVLRMFELDKPIIAAINGPAVGVGITLPLAADFRIAADDSRMAFVFTRRGLVPESCSSWFLPRLVAMQTALDWVLSGRMFSAQEALEAGLLRSVHPREDLLDAAYELARSIVGQTSTVSVALARQMMWRMLGADHPMRAHIVETHALNLRGVSADAREGISAFIEKREARYPLSVSSDLPEVWGSFPAPSYEAPA